MSVIIKGIPHNLEVTNKKILIFITVLIPTRFAIFTVLFNAKNFIALVSFLARFSNQDGGLNVDTVR